MSEQETIDIAIAVGLPNLADTEGLHDLSLGGSIHHARLSVGGRTVVDEDKREAQAAIFVRVLIAVRNKAASLVRQA
jgi:hypothetical protein